MEVEKRTEVPEAGKERGGTTWTGSQLEKRNKVRCSTAQYRDYN